MERGVRPKVLIAIVEGPDAAEPDVLDGIVDAGVTDLVVDLTEVPAVSTRRLNALLHARQRLLERGGTVAVVTPRRLRRPLELMRFDARFLLASNPAEALHVLRASGFDDGYRTPLSRAA